MANEPLDHSEGSSSSYRAYMFGESGRIDCAITIMAESDEAAVAQARGLIDSHCVEVWDRSRMVIRLSTQSLQ